jgi:hypothetical protein
MFGEHLPEGLKQVLIGLPQGSCHPAAIELGADVPGQPLAVYRLDDLRHN